MASSVSEESNSTKLPSELCLKHAAKLAVVEDKPVMFDYWVDSLEKKCFIGVKEGSEGEKLLVKDEDQYTSPISKIYKVNTEYLICSENSIYIVDDSITTRRIS